MVEVICNQSLHGMCTNLLGKIELVKAANVTPVKKTKLFLIV